MIGALIGAAIGVGGQVFNAIAGAREASRQRRELDRQERENQAWYDRRYNEVGHERADAQRLLTKMHDQARDSARAAAGRQAVVGASSSAVAAQKQAASNAIGDTVGKIDAAQEARRDKIEQQYRATKQDISNARNKLSAARQANIASAAGSASALGVGIAGAIEQQGKSTGAASTSTPTGAAQSPSTVTPAATPATTTPGGYNPYTSVWDDNVSYA